MKLESILDQIDLGNYALPVFQRGYVWNRDQVRKLMNSLYKGYPIGSLLTWATNLDIDLIRGNSDRTQGTVYLILDGQQRITSLYGIIRGKPPRFFEGDPRAFTNLFFNVETEVFEFYAPMKMDNDSSWINVTELMKLDAGNFVQTRSEYLPHLSKLNKIGNIKNVILPIQEVSGEDKTVDVVVEIFNNVNSGGTKLSKGDLALAKLCASWPEARDEMNKILSFFRNQGFNFSMDWLLRCITVYLTGQPYFSFLSQVDSKSFIDALRTTKNMIGTILDQIGSKLGLDHDRVLAGKFTIPVMIELIKQNGGHIKDPNTWNKMLFWYVHAALWGRYSGSTESVLAHDLNILENGEGIDGLINVLKKSRGDLIIRPEDFLSWSVGSRFYPLMYLLTRVNQCLDWESGVELKSILLGKSSSLELHHIFPKKLLYDAGYDKADVNTLANLTFLTKGTNIQISASNPSQYLPEIDEKLPGVLESHWIPMDRSIWEISKYSEFTARRRELLAKIANTFLDSLYHSKVETEVASKPSQGITQILEPRDAEEDEQLLDVLSWLEENGLSTGELDYELSNEAGEAVAVFDLAWPEGLQFGLSGSLALLLNEPTEIHQIANQYGYRYFTDIDEFKEYVQTQFID